MRNLLFLDTETTDLKDGRLVELAFAIHDLDYPQPGVIRSVLVKPPVPISHDAMATHHITEAMVINQPSFQEHPSYPDIKDAAKRMVLVAHNAPFDIDVLDREGIEVGEWIDTKRVAMHVFPDAPKHNLQFLRYYLGCAVAASAHSAVGDVAVLIAVFRKIAARIEQEYETLNYGEVVAKAIELTKKPVLMKLAPFRLKKHAGKTFEEINRVDHDYLVWAWKQDWQDADLQGTLDHWVNRRVV